MQMSILQSIVAKLKKEQKLWIGHYHTKIKLTDEDSFHQTQKLSIFYWLD